VTVEQLNKNRGHELLPKELREKLPPLYSNEDVGLEAQAIIKLFSPYSNFTWYFSEGSPVDDEGYYDTNKPKVDYLLFGLTVGFEPELGYTSLTELESLHQRGLPLVERDLHWQPDTLKNLMKRHDRA
jgi:hypothetical protein